MTFNISINTVAAALAVYLHVYTAECRCVHLDTLPLAVELQAAAAAAVIRGRDVQVIGRRAPLPLLVINTKLV